MARIAVGGFQHETNTFSPTLATLDEFEKHDGWPGLTRGEAMFDAVAGINIPIEGFIQAAREDGHDLVPLAWSSAEPSSYVTEEAFETITGMLCEDLAAKGPFDAVYLDLHGAMAVEHHEDGEGETLARVRDVVGFDIPVVNSLDLHANVTERMVQMSSVMTIFRTYPHIDMDVTAARVYRQLQRILAGETMAKAFRKSPFLVPLTAQWTDAPPNRTLYDMVMAEELDGVANVDLALAFPPTDIHDCGPAVVAYDPDPERAAAVADRVIGAFIDAEPDFDNALLSPDEAVQRAMGHGSGPVVLADAQDNPGAGGTSDTVGVLEALVRNGARKASVALLNDPEVAMMAHQAGEGAVLSVDLGGKSGQDGQAPFNGDFRVERLGDGVFECTGEMYRGVTTNLGPMALLKVDGADCDVSVVVSSNRFQNLDQACFRHIGVEPTEQQILVVKSTVHYRADYDPIAAETLTVEAPGAHPCRLVGLPYKHLREGVRLEPMGPEHRMS
ncbi:MAG: M81 family metallopeptidase [Pseudomonadota bacterium]